VILLIAVVAGLLVGTVWTRWRGDLYQPPDLKYLWLVFIAFLPQFIALYLPSTRERVPDTWSAVLLPVSQTLLLGFVWLNRRLPGMKVLFLGVALNLTVMAANGGFMPINPQTASRLVTQEVLENHQPGDRFGTKDILLLPQETRFEWLADRFLPPAWSAYQVAFSLGDVFIALGVFWLLANQKTPKKQPLSIYKGVPI
jgi:hypothetical protein